MAQALKLSDDACIEVLHKWSGLGEMKRTTHMDKLCSLPQKIIGVFAGNQGGKCLTLNAKISTPLGEIPLKTLYEDEAIFPVYAFDGRGVVCGTGCVPFKKDAKEPCVRFGFSDGGEVEMALGHRILTASGWRSIRDVLCTYFGVLEGSNLESYLSTHASGVLSFCRTRRDYEDRCSQGCRRCGEPPPFCPDSDRVLFPSQAYVQRHSSHWSYSDGQEYIYTYNDQTTLPHPSNLGAVPQIEGQTFEFSDPVFCTDAQPMMSKHQTFQQPSIAGYSGPQLNNEDHLGQKRVSSACVSPFFVNGNEVISYTFIGSQDVYDFTVVPTHNYIASGLVHHNTANAAFTYVMRVLGIHPVEEKNRLAKQIRCLSSSLPESSDAAEQDNTQYLELKKMIPPEMIIKDITARSKVLVVASPTHGKSYFEFMSTKQELQDTGKVQRCSLWEDEEPPKPFREESRRRLLTRGGDEIITLTPINGLSYLYDDVWNKKGYIWRSDTICEALGMPREEYIKEGDPNIACVQIATDDNPIMSKEVVDLNFSSEDPDEILVRRYGVFKQIAGRVHKSFNDSVHVIDYNKYFPNDIPYEWTHARGIDYHESRIPWSVGWVSISPDDEWFVWQEFHPAIDGPRAMNTWEISKSIVRRSGDYYYLANLIDPLANKKQANTLFSVTDDLNRYFEQLRVDHGMGTPTLWEGWDTKDTKGYNEIRARMKNSLKVKTPFNNIYREKGEKKTLPTIWFCNVPRFVRSIKLWSYEEWATPTSRAVNDPKSKRQEKNSHDNMVLEALAKDQRLRNYKWAFRDQPMMFSRTGRPVRHANMGVH
jgi:hypothetical protein